MLIMKENTKYKGYIIINTTAENCFQIVKEDDPYGERIPVNVCYKYEVKKHIDALLRK